MITKFNRILATSDSPAAPSGGSNGDVPPQADPRAVLAAMVAQRESPPAPVTQDSPPVAATATPEAPQDPAPAAETGPENLTPETEPAAEGENPETAGETTETNEPTAPEEAEPADDLARLSPTERKAAAELVKKLHPGEIPRIAKLLSERHQLESTVESLQKQLDEAESRTAEAAVRPPESGVLPEAIAKLKTVAEVQTRLDEVQSHVDALTDFLDRNPGDAATAYTIGDREMTREELIGRRAQLRSELKLLPQRGQQIATATQFHQAKTAAQAETLKRFPVLTDADNPLTKQVRELSKLPQFAREVNGEELAYYLALGKQAAEAQQAVKAKPAATVRQVNPKIPLGKPHQAGTAGSAKGNGADVKSILARHGTERSSGSFAALLSATGR